MLQKTMRNRLDALSLSGYHPHNDRGDAPWVMGLVSPARANPQKKDFHGYDCLI